MTFTVGAHEIVLISMTCLLAFGRPAVAAETPTTLFHPPIGIESVFPVTVIRHSELTELEQNANGYEIWGKEVVTQSDIPIHFSTAISYPWEYSEIVAERLSKRLQDLSYIRSAKVEFFPSIHPQLLRLYKNLQPFAAQERIIRVTLKHWPHAQLLSFPTFAVLVFNYQDPKLSYSDIVKDWKKTIEDFRKLHELRTLLGIEPRLPWQTMPTLTWVNLPYYGEPDFWNRYWGGSDRDGSDRNKQFLRENSLASFGVADPTHRVIHCNHISYEHTSMGNDFRYFYAVGDWFRGADDTIYVSSSSAEMMWMRIVRAALLVNVVLPEMEKRSADEIEKLTKTRLRLVNARKEAFEVFALSAIDTLHKEVGQIEGELRGIATLQGRIKESLDGYESLLMFLANPFGGPSAKSANYLKNLESAEKGWNCVEEYFSFEQDNRLLVNDRRKGDNYLRKIQMNLQRLNDSSNSLQHEVSDSLSLLEARRSLLWSKWNTLSAIIYPAVGALGALLARGVWIYFRKKKDERQTIIYPAGSALLSGGLYWFYLRQQSGERRTVPEVVFPALGAILGSILWWWFEF